MTTTCTTSRHEWVITPGTDGLEQECRNCDQWRRTPIEEQTWRNTRKPITYSRANELRKQSVMTALAEWRKNDKPDGVTSVAEREAMAAIQAVLMFEVALKNGSVE